MRSYQHDLRHHMAQCETNYQRLRQLFPSMEHDDERVLTVNQGQANWCLSLRVAERHRYTTMIELTQQLLGQAWVPDVVLSLRMYHDARMVEVLSYQKRGHLQARHHYPNSTMLQPDEKAQHNLMLTECLSMAMDHGFDESLDMTPSFASAASGRYSS